HRCNAGINRDKQRVSRKGCRIAACALLGSRHGDHLGRAQHLAEALVLPEVEALAASVVELSKHDRSAVCKPELVAAEGWDTARLHERRVVEIVPGVERRVAQKF